MASKTDEVSTTEAENVDDTQTVFKVAEDPERTDQKAAQVASAPPGPLSDVKTKLMVIRQKVDRNRAKRSRLEREWFSRRTTLLASKERRSASCSKIAARPWSRKPSQKQPKLWRRQAQRLRVVPPTSAKDATAPCRSQPKRNHSTQQRRTSHRGRESEHVARHHAKREWK